jgi:hypothetical protein
MTTNTRYRIDKSTSKQVANIKHFLQTIPIITMMDLYIEFILLIDRLDVGIREILI